MAITIEMETKNGITLETKDKYCDDDVVVIPDAQSRNELKSSNIRSGVTILGVEGTMIDGEGKVNHLNGPSLVYVTDENGNDFGLPWDYNGNQGTVPVRGTSGALQVGFATGAYDAVNLSQMLDELAGALAPIDGELFEDGQYTNLEHGSYDSNGEKSESGNDKYYWRTVGLIPIGDFISVSNNEDGYKMISRYDENKSFISRSGWTRTTPVTKESILSAVPNTKYIAIHTRRYNDWSTGEFTKEQLAATEFTISIKKSRIEQLEENCQEQSQEIESIKEKIDTLPSYYADHIAGKIETINTRIMTAGKNGDSFFFITDLHWPSNAKKSPLLIREIHKYCAIDTIMLNGDYQNQYNSVTSAVKKIRECITSFDLCGTKTFVNVGNHEFNDPGASAPDHRLTNDQVYSVVIKPQENRIVTSDGQTVILPFYFDNTKMKRRYYFIPANYGSNIDDNVRRWFGKSLKELPDGYDAVIISHIAVGVSSGTIIMDTHFEAIAGMIDAYNARTTYTYGSTTYDYSSATGRVLCVLCGHKHRDGNIQTTGGIPIIATTCDAYAQDKDEERATSALGTVNEQAFDVVTIDKNANKIYLTRIGYGEDRSFDLP